MFNLQKLQNTLSMKQLQLILNVFTQFSYLYFNYFTALANVNRNKTNLGQM